MSQFLWLDKKQKKKKKGGLCCLHLKCFLPSAKLIRIVLKSAINSVDYIQMNACEDKLSFSIFSGHKERWAKSKEKWRERDSEKEKDRQRERLRLGDNWGVDPKKSSEPRRQQHSRYQGRLITQHGGGTHQRRRWWNIPQLGQEL